METLTSAEAAARLGVNPQKFHRIVAAHQVAPVLEGTGLRGPKFWDPADIDTLLAELGGDAA